MSDTGTATSPGHPGGRRAPIVHQTRQGRGCLQRWPAVNHYELQAAAFNRAVRDGVAYPCPLEFSRGTQAMMDAAFASAV